MKIVSLLENTTQRPDMQVEHGLSLYIETADHKILFDMGQTDLFAKNAEVLGVDLSQVDLAVLSHGHYDHGGGLKKFLELNQKAPVYIQKDAFLPHYGSAATYIGLDTSLLDSPRVILTEDLWHLDTGLTLMSCNQRTREYNFGQVGLTEKVGDEFIPDDFRHEQYLLIEEAGKSVLISGCSHKGILDIAQWFSPDVLIGGFHFSKMPLDQALSDAAKTLDAHKTEFYTCHCTGLDQYAHMKKSMSRLNYLSCGETLIL